MKALNDEFNGRQLVAGRQPSLRSFVRYHRCIAFGIAWGTDTHEMAGYFRSDEAFFRLLFIALLRHAHPPWSGTVVETKAKFKVSFALFLSLAFSRTPKPLKLVVASVVQEN